MIIKTRKLDTQIINPNGEIVFEKKDFEVPENWSDRAATIVASKYAMDSENSVIDIIDRIVNQISEWGEEQGYFKEGTTLDPHPDNGITYTEEEKFRYDLKNILLNQRAAFNSPVWFNCGSDTKNNQMSACFVVPVEDTMESILEHNTIEGNIFKGGSGAGCNVSKIRAKGEQLSNKGQASGPISFMKMWDSTAGVIKSGGKTRRSAKMIEMDVDHPDIMEFIECKKTEEDKAKALIATGINPEEAYATVAFQNTNHSIRVTNEFMTAVNDDLKYCLTERNNPDNFKEVNARDILTRTAEIAWETGDPGIQFDDRMNEDNPVPSIGSINGTNPCSEFCAVENSSCNLSSLNLVKYMNEKRNFDFIKFEDDIKIIVTAMDILIDAADYPTKEIEEMTRKTRPLGLGFSNLGAYLMLKGMPYNSTTAREEAAKITCAMTTAAYKQSIALAEKLGSFELFDDNIEKNMKIIEQLTDDSYLAGDAGMKGLRNSQVTLLAPAGTISFAMDCDTTGIEPLFALQTVKQLAGGGTMMIDYPCVNKAKELNTNKDGKFNAAILQTANEIPWKAHIDMMAACQKHLNGAISKCVVADTMIPTENGIIKIGDFYSGEKEDTFSDTNLIVASEGKTQLASEFYYGGLRNTIKVTLKDGRVIEGTPNHRIKAVKKTGEFDWIRLDELSRDQYVGVKFGDNLWPENKNIKIKFKQPELYGCQKEIKIPKQPTKELGWFLGAYIAEGNMSRSNWTVVITNNNDFVLEKAKTIGEKLFGLEGKITRNKRNNVGCICFNSKSLYLFLDYVGATGNAETKEIPWIVLQSYKEVVQEFVKGLWLDGYVRKSNTATAICLKSKKIIDQLQIVFTNFGIRSNKIKKYNKKYDRYFYELFVHGAELKAFNKEFGPLDDEWKQEQIDKHSIKLEERKYNRIHSDVFPCYGKEIKECALKYGKKSDYPSLFNKRTKNPSIQLVKDIIHGHRDKYQDTIGNILDNNIHFVPIISIENSLAEVYDFHVPSNNAFIGNGIINHNTINMPSDTTVENIYDAYFYAWKAGLKALAIYRDGSKTMQPMTDADKKEETDNKQEKNKIQEEWCAIRKKLPRTRDSITHAFNIGGFEGYLTVGLYEDGSPGEMFINMQKEGSTISGLMDSFAVLLSFALQYGVPLERLVQKFRGTKFDPAGFTDNAEIRMCTSIMDYVFRWLDLQFFSAEEETVEHEEEKENIEYENNLKPIDASGMPCLECGHTTVLNGTCYQCLNCGTTTGCS